MIHTADREQGPPTSWVSCSEYQRSVILVDWWMDGLGLELWLVFRRPEMKDLGVSLGS